MFSQILPITLLIAFAVDALIGDPIWLPHPIRLIGKAISVHERLLRRVSKRTDMEVFLGGVLVVSVVGLTYIGMSGVTAFLSHIFGGYNLFWGISYYDVSIGVLGSFAIASNGLISAVLGVGQSLLARDLAQARERLSHVVGRDTQSLKEDGIIRAAIETLAENASDAIIAPLFYFAIGGIELAFAYKAVNTIDSMIGYKNQRYLYFGRIGAKIDDAVNFIPARLTALLICLSAFVLRISNVVAYGACKRYDNYNFKESIRVLLRDGRKHTSPNAGMPEAAMAGALDVRLGGPSYYAGVLVEKPFIGNYEGAQDVQMIRRSVIIVRLVSVMGLLVSMVLSITMRNALWKLI
ncbi:MAG: cobalamin biosynthesis protein CobD [Nitrospirae bacterium]|nr:cobalamin biosynthesis protein CobD [Nitrospirota bacterium]